MAQRFVTFVLSVWLFATLAACGSAAPSGQPAPPPGGVVATLHGRRGRSIRAAG